MAHPLITLSMVCSVLSIHLSIYLSIYLSDVIVLRHTCNDDSISEITGLTGLSSRSGTSYFTNLPKLAYYG